MQITIKKVNSDYVTIKLGETKYISYLHSIKGRVYDKTFNEHKIPLLDWDKFQLSATKDKVEFVGLDKVKNISQIPRLTLEYKYIGLKNIQDVYSISKSVRLDYIRNIYTLPKNEAYLLDPKYTEYATKELQEVILRQVSQRKSLANTDSIIKEEIFNDVKLYPFQSQDVRKMGILDGRVLLAHPVGLGKSLMSIKYNHDNGYRVLIACPGFAKANWSREILKLIPDAKIKTLNGRVPQSHEIEYVFDKSIKFLIINYEVLCSVVKDTHGNETYIWAELLKLAKFDSFIVDEAHKLGNSSAQRSKAAMSLSGIPHIQALSASPFTNRVSELFPILHLLNPSVYDNQTQFDNQFAGANLHHDHAHDVLSTVMIRRKKEDVLPQLPPVNRITEYYELTEKAMGLYEKVLNGIYYNMLSKDYDIEDGKNVQHMLEEFLRLKQICAFDKVDFTSDLATKLYDSTNEKVLVFSQFLPSIKAIADRLGNETAIIDGSVSMEERMRIVDRFQDPKSDLHFIVGNPKAMGESLTLTAAKYIIFNDLLWNPLSHMQASGRAYGRLNDAHGIDEYWVIAEDTIEKRILDLLWAKQYNFDRVIDGEVSEKSGSIFMNLIKEMATTKILKQEKL
jgi:SNF2 family DNA or RNA helicase